VAPTNTRRRRVTGTTLNRNGQSLRSFGEFSQAWETRQREERVRQERAAAAATSVRDAFEQDEYLYLVQEARLDSSDEEEEPPVVVVPRRRRRRRSESNRPRERGGPLTQIQAAERSERARSSALTEPQRSAAPTEVFEVFEDERRAISFGCPIIPQGFRREYRTLHEICRSGRDAFTEGSEEGRVVLSPEEHRALERELSCM
jgi:hypothetical protein